MKLKPWVVAGVVSLLLSTAGCGTAGNTANTGNAAGFLGNTVGRPLQQGANTIANIVGVAPDRVGNVTGLKPVVYVDSATKTIDLRVHDTAPGGVNTVNRDAVVTRNDGLAITVPPGWTVVVSGATPQIGSSLSIASYRGGLVGARIANNLGTSYKVATIGQFAVVSVVPGRPDRIMDIVTVASGITQPTIAPYAL
jgi:lambda repressor-like predicted transcriptional regulator